MQTSLHYWLRLLISFLGLWGCGWLMLVIRRRRAEKGEVIPIITKPYTMVEKTRAAVVNGAKIGLGMVLGMAMIDLWQYHHTYVVVNAVVESQMGVNVVYRFEHDPSHQTYGFHFCEGRYLPEFKPHQIIETIQFVRSHDSTGECEDLSPGTASLRLRRVNGVPILATQED